MKNRVGFLIACLCVFMVISRSLYAHHAMSLFDQKTVISVPGDVTEFNFSNPHATLFMDVIDSKGNVDKWVIEFGPPAQLKRDGQEVQNLYRFARLHVPVL
jgi:hypothetical protein